MRDPRYRIVGWEFEADRGVLRAPDGAEVVLRPKTARVLLSLVERCGRVISRDDLIDAVWPGVHITDNSLTQCVAEIRRALGCQGALLRTLPRRGYLLDIPRPEAPTDTPSHALTLAVHGACGGAPAESQSRPATLPATPRAAGSIPIVAMVPLRLPPGDDRELASFADIMLDALVGALAALREPIVISANSTRRLAGTDEPAPVLARRVGADYLGTGSLRRQGSQVRLSLDLAEAAQGAVVWQRAHDLPVEALLTAPDELAATIAHAILPRLRDAELRTALRRQHDLGAYHLMLEGQRWMHRLERASFDKAGELLRRAAALDPGFAGPHAALAFWHSLRIGQRWSDDPAAEALALEAAVRHALVLDGDHARALALLGHSRSFLHRDYSSALELHKRALDIAPNDAETNLWTIPTLAFTGQGDEAVRRAERAIRLSPMDPLLYRSQHVLSIALYTTGSWEEAADWGIKSMRSNGEYTSNLRFTAAALAASGRMDEARVAASRLLALTPAVRVDEAVARVPFRDPALRTRFGQHLLAAGIPP